MKKLILSIGSATLVLLVLVGGVLAAGPRGTPAGDPARDRDAVPTILGLTEAQVMDLRHDGLSLAQIAERQKVDPQKLVEALMAQWTERIEARNDAGALTDEAAAALKAQVELRARDQVYKVTAGGMRGVAVGAGPGSSGQGAAGAAGAGNGTCDGDAPRDGSGMRNGNGSGGAGRR
jgi:hypothetical protein